MLDQFNKIRTKLQKRFAKLDLSKEQKLGLALLASSLVVLVGAIGWLSVDRFGSSIASQFNRWYLTLPGEKSGKLVMSEMARAVDANSHFYVEVDGLVQANDDQLAFAIQNDVYLNSSDGNAVLQVGQYQVGDLSEHFRGFDEAHFTSQSGADDQVWMGYRSAGEDSSWLNTGDVGGDLASVLETMYESGALRLGSAQRATHQDKHVFQVPVSLDLLNPQVANIEVLEPIRLVMLAEPNYITILKANLLVDSQTLLPVWLEIDNEALDLQIAFAIDKQPAPALGQPQYVVWQDVMSGNVLGASTDDDADPSMSSITIPDFSSETSDQSTIFTYEVQPTPYVFSYTNDDLEGSL